MKFGVFATFMSPLATPDIITDFAKKVEAARLDSIWMGEHVVLFDEMEFPYPGSKDGKIPTPPNGGLLDTVATFGLLAGATKNVRLGTGITLLPQRNPIYTAKEFATLDWLSSGRIDFGIGVGWCKEEVIACGYAWEDRGERCDEFLELTQKLWTEPVISHEGKHFQVNACKMDPKPVQNPMIPIIVGGHSKAAYRRAAKFGSGWYGFALTPELAKPMIDGVRTEVEAAGRSMDDFELLITPPYNINADTVKAFEDMGVERLVMMMGGQKPDALERRLDQVSELMAIA
ncbi:MAG: LLM class F420-dependent oxidoreductase [Pseudomonadota bacterium]